jgi:hypothetical protein
VIARGTQVAAHVAKSAALAQKSGLYITDIGRPGSLEEILAG